VKIIISTTTFANVSIRPLYIIPWFLCVQDIGFQVRCAYIKRSKPRKKWVHFDFIPPIEPPHNQLHHRHYLTVKAFLVQDGPWDNSVCWLWVHIPIEWPMTSKPSSAVFRLHKAHTSTAGQGIGNNSVRNILILPCISQSIQLTVCLFMISFAGDCHHIWCADNQDYLYRGWSAMINIPVHDFEWGQGAKEWNIILGVMQCRIRLRVYNAFTYELSGAETPLVDEIRIRMPVGYRKWRYSFYTENWSHD